MLLNPRSLSELASDATFGLLYNSFKLVESKYLQILEDGRCNVVSNNNVQLTLPRTGRAGERVGIFVSHVQNKSVPVVACSRHKDKALVDPKLDKSAEFPGYSVLQIPEASYKYDAVGTFCKYRTSDPNGQVHTNETKGYLVSVPVENKAHIMFKSVCNGTDNKGKYELKHWHLTAKLFSSDDTVLAETTFTVQFRAKIIKPGLSPPKRIKMEEEPAAEVTYVIQPMNQAMTAVAVSMQNGEATLGPVLEDVQPQQIWAALAEDPQQGQGTVLEQESNSVSQTLTMWNDLTRRYIIASEKWAENNRFIMPSDEFRKTVELKEAEAERANQFRLLREWQLDIEAITNNPELSNDNQE